jgi:Ca2+-binding RTX toxin-like protein
VCRPTIVEGLEARTLLSAGPMVSGRGTLVSQGDGGNNVIVVSRDPRRPSKILVTVDGSGKKFNSRGVKRIEMSGGGGADRLTLDDSLGVISARGATLMGGDGNDTLVGGLAAATFEGGNGDDSILGSSKADLMTGEAGDDTLVGGKGNDLIDGDGGDDVIHGSAGDDILYGDAGNDSVFGEVGSDTIGGDGEDRLMFKGFSAPAAEPGTDWLDGGDGDDWITGGDESATLHDQNNGRDTITGGAGDDVLDTRSWNEDSTNPADVIMDRQAGDVVPMEDYTRQATAAELARGEDAYAVHIHAKMEIFINVGGTLRQVQIPGGLGDFVDPAHPDNTSPVFHTHGDPGNDGVLHMHDLDPRTFTLGEFFRNWGVTIDANHIGRYVAGNGHTLKIVVHHANGHRQVLTDPYNYVVQGAADWHNGDFIEVTYT